MAQALMISFCMVCSAALVPAETAEDLIAKNLEAKGGIARIKAIHSLRMSGKLQSGAFVAQVGQDAMEPNFLRETFTIQGMTQIQAYDGSIGWQISPFEGRRDAEQVGELGLRNLVEAADFHGPLVDYEQKGNTVEYLGHDTVDGDDALRLKVTLKNGDIFYYYLDPDAYLEIRIEKQQFIRGAVHETVTDLGSYKQIAGVYQPFSIETGSKNDPNGRAKITFDKIEANVAIDAAEFKMPNPKPASPKQP